MTGEGGFVPPSELIGEALLDYLRQSFSRTPLHRLLGLRMLETTEPGAVTIEMPVAEGAMSQSGNLHGGAIATLVDVACGSCAARASNFHPAEQSLVTADLHVRYLGRPKGDVVRATARVMRAGRMLTVIECRVADEHGNVVAVADFSSMLVPRRAPLPQAAVGDAAAPEL